MGDKPKLAICWLGACGGCDEAIVDLNEVILKVADAVDIVLWPVAMDFKYSHIRAMEDKEIAVSLITGSVRNSDHLEMAHLLRAKSELVIAMGACACLGGTPGLANFITKDDIFNWVYRDAPTVVNPNGSFPQTETTINGNTVTLPEFYDHVYTLDQAIEVDYYLPGCPAPPHLIENAINSLLSGHLPPKGSVLALRRALCDGCERNETKPNRIEMKNIKRVHEIEPDPDFCFLVQGIICMGPVTRMGCGHTCIHTNTPCRGCFGPVPGAAEGGAKYLSGLVSLIKAESDEDVKRIIDSIVDPAGYFYRFSQPSSILGARKLE
ncbi:oxidoreductase [Thermodesulfobacteriota bacterium]